MTHRAAPTVLNFADLGGHLTTDGRRVRRRHLYRAGLLLDATAAPQDLAIRAVLDLRSPTECQQRPARWPQARYLEAGPAHDAELIQPAGWHSKLQDPGFGAAQAHQAVRALYRKLPAGFAPALRVLFDHLLTKPDGATLIHCSAGKDRTGFVSAMLLLALDVPVATVLTDYLASQDRLAEPAAQALLRSLLQDLPGHAQPAARVLCGVQEDFLMAALRAIEDEHCGLETYLARSCGLTPANRRQLQQFCCQ